MRGSNVLPMRMSRDSPKRLRRGSGRRFVTGSRRIERFDVLKPALKDDDRISKCPTTKLKCSKLSGRIISVIGPPANSSDSALSRRIFGPRFLRSSGRRLRGWHEVVTERNVVHAHRNTIRTDTIVDTPGIDTCVGYRKTARVDFPCITAERTESYVRIDVEFQPVVLNCSLLLLGDFFTHLNTTQTPASPPRRSTRVR